MQTRPEKLFSHVARAMRPEDLRFRRMRRREYSGPGVMYAAEIGMVFLTGQVFAKKPNKKTLWAWRREIISAWEEITARAAYGYTNDRALR